MRMFLFCGTSAEWPKSIPPPSQKKNRTQRRRKKGGGRKAKWQADRHQQLSPFSKNGSKVTSLFLSGVSLKNNRKSCKLFEKRYEAHLKNRPPAFGGRQWWGDKRSQKLEMKTKQSRSIARRGVLLESWRWHLLKSLVFLFLAQQQRVWVLSILNVVVWSFVTPCCVLYTSKKRCE